MDANKEDTSQSFRTLLFLILFLLFVLASSGNSRDHTSSSVKYSSQNELVYAYFSSHHNAIIPSPVSIPDLQKYCEGALLNTSYNSFSFLNKISDYNRKIALKIILIQKSTLAIETDPLWRLYYRLSLNEDDTLPVLS